MGSFWDGVNDDVAARFVGAKAPGFDAALRQVEAGATPSASGLTPDDWLTAVVLMGLNSPDELGPPLVQQPPPRPALREALREDSLAEAFPRTPRATRLALSAGLLLIHDFWGPSHEAAQEAEDQGEARFSAYWHGIAHRREPDAGNALYWFRRVGRHPVFAPLAEAARPILEEHADRAWLDRLLGPGGWNPGAMIDLCTGARPGSPRETLARRLQRLEMLHLLVATAVAARG